MKAVILAAGKGTRMQHSKHKTLIKIKEKSILHHNLDNLLEFVDEFIFIVGYKSGEIKNEFGNEYKGKKVSYVVQEEQLGTGHALYQAKNYIKSKFINLNGDDIYSLKDIKNCLKYDLAILTDRVDDPENFGVVLEEKGYLKDIIEKPKEFISNLINTGLFIFTLEIFKELDDIIKNNKKSLREEFELIDAVRQLSKKEKIKVIKVKGHWLPHNKLEDIKKSEEFFKKNIN